MKPPIQNYDLQPMHRVRIRGTQSQIVSVHSWLLELMQQRARQGRKGYTLHLGTSGPAAGDEETKQWAMAFYIADDLVVELRQFLGLLGLQEET